MKNKMKTGHSGISSREKSIVSLHTLGDDVNPSSAQVNVSDVQGLCHIEKAQWHDEPKGRVNWFAWNRESFERHRETDVKAALSQSNI
jgi:hypothetical protein